MSLPFGALDRPSLALGLLQAHCTRAGILCDTEYLTFRFAETVGLADYQWVCADLPYTAFAGEWLFAEALYGHRPEADERYLTGVLRDTWQLPADDIDRLCRLRTHVEPFLAECLRTLPAPEHTLVGFTSVFHQNIASLALAQRVKQHRPDVTVAFGGGNWEEPMGSALLRQFPFVDLAFSGEADQSFPAVLEARRANRPRTPIPGVTWHGAPPPRSATVADLDGVPVPDFRPYFRQLRATKGATSLAVTLPVETSRGCWWGARSHCTFCGLNGSTMAFRSKTPDRVLTEFAELRERYGRVPFGVVDNILDSRYFRSVLPMLAGQHLDVSLFWEVKANLNRFQVRQLRDAGARFIQPGIESLSDHVLTVMRKGTTALRNIELLKWCREYAVVPLWNQLYGFPGETAEDYAAVIPLIHAIWHLDPPLACGPLRLDRFSPYHQESAAHGMTNIRPMAPFRHLYPFDRKAVDEIAYYFDFDYADGRRADTHAGDVIALTATWMADPDRGTLTLSTGPDGMVRIADSRRGVAAPRWTVLDGWAAAVYLACDRSRRFAALAELPEVRDAAVGGASLRDFLDCCVRERLMVHDAGRWLGVAVHAFPRDDEPERPT
ncbi:RiPP maturation radical SAM C-methyltransferase [Streptomyces ochraceiscleroticus]|uniref:RiPP maturation radical SAM C-methyltransferase n=1 Tax=Streptomyces ochraceiscleroticus TaxID=47761 RepID=A0ABW1MMR5_9ACTN|nr:RiPP maturation radical SAM C-methyltransferase [Streptomyces ochraceiscleroticus]